MVLGTTAPQFPFDPYYQSKLASNPKYIAGQALNNTTSIIPALIKQYQMGKLLQGINGPQQQPSPTTAGVGGAITPQAGSPVSDPNALIMKMMAFDPESAATYANLGSKLAETKKTNMETAGMLPYQRANLDEMIRSHQDNEETRKLQIQLQTLMHEGQLNQEANSLEERKRNNTFQNHMKTQEDNAKYPFRNAWRSFRNQPPLFQDPSEIGNGWSQAEENRLQELKRRHK